MKKTVSIASYIAIIVSIITFSISTIENIRSQYSLFIYIIEIICISIFIFEYLYKLVIYKLRFVISISGILELLVIIPFFFGVNSIFFRIFRFFRITRILKTLKLLKALNHIKEAFYQIKQELILFSFLTIFILFFAAAGIYTFEHDAQPEIFSNIFHSLWWSIITLTIGSDIQPITIGGKIFTALILMTGLGIVAVPTGLIASALSKKDAKNQDNGS